MCDTTDKFSIKDNRDYAWSYFSLHAEQRLKTFHFYIIIITLLLGAIFALVKVGSNTFTLPLGLLITFFSFIFWKLDMRNKELIYNAENELKKLEIQDGILLFKNEENMTDSQQDNTDNDQLFDKHYTYSKSFNTVFFIFGIVGIFIVLFTLIGFFKLNVNEAVLDFFIYFTSLTLIVFLLTLITILFFKKNKTSLKISSLIVCLLFSMGVVCVVKIVEVDKYIILKTNKKLPDRLKN